MDPLLPGSGLPAEGCGQDGPPAAQEVLEATDPALGALRCLWTRLGSSPGPGWASAEYCSSVLGQPGPAPHSAGQSGSVCGGTSLPSQTFSLAVVAAATWCSGGPPAARWAASGPSCTAAWRARCCGPGNSPSGRRGTVTGRKAQIWRMLS